MLRDIPRQRKSRIPILVDLIEDNTRNRWIFPLCALLIYVLIVVSITNIEDTVKIFFYLQFK